MDRRVHQCSRRSFRRAIRKASRPGWWDAFQEDDVNIKVTITHLDGPHKGEKAQFILPHDTEEITLGRTVDNLVSFEGKETVSRHHAKIVLEGERGLQLVHLADSNKTFLNGNEIRQAWLESGDVVELAREGARIKVQFSSLNGEGAASRYVVLWGVVLGTFLGLLTFGLIYFLQKR
ncbi:MAG: FHA domain-containing protein [Deltaproteobacteria bacterium]|nr:MAG: FHA domain-containing protein [Deltaproteobacteria bacterium]